MSLTWTIFGFRQCNYESDVRGHYKAWICDMSYILFAKKLHINYMNLICIYIYSSLQDFSHLLCWDKEERISSTYAKPNRRNYGFTIAGKVHCATVYGQMQAIKNVMRNFQAR